MNTGFAGLGSGEGSQVSVQEVCDQVRFQSRVFRSDGGQEDSLVRVMRRLVFKRQFESMQRILPK